MEPVFVVISLFLSTIGYWTKSTSKYVLELVRGGGGIKVQFPQSQIIIMKLFH